MSKNNTCDTCGHYLSSHSAGGCTVRVYVDGGFSFCDCTIQVYPAVTKPKHENEAHIVG